MDLADLETRRARASTSAARADRGRADPGRVPYLRSSAAARRGRARSPRRSGPTRSPCSPAPHKRRCPGLAGAGEGVRALARLLRPVGDRPGGQPLPGRTPSARVDWQSVLRARIAQRQDLIDASARAVAAAEQAALPILRDALLADLAARPPPATQSARRCRPRFLVDMLRRRTPAHHPDPPGDREHPVAAVGQAVRVSWPPTTRRSAGPIDASTRSPPRGCGWGSWRSWRAATDGVPVPRAAPRPDAAGPPAPAAAGLRTLFDEHPRLRPVQRRRPPSTARRRLPARRSGMTFTYLDPTRSPEHQDDATRLSARARRRAEPGDRSGRCRCCWPSGCSRPATSGRAGLVLDGLPVRRRHAGLDLRPDQHRDTCSARPDLPSTVDDAAGPVHAGRPPALAVHALHPAVRSSGCHLDFADAEFTRETDESVAHARTPLRHRPAAARRAGAPAAGADQRRRAARCRSRSWSRCAAGPSCSWPSSARAATSPACRAPRRSPARPRSASPRRTGSRR